MTASGPDCARAGPARHTAARAVTPSTGGVATPNGVWGRTTVGRARL